VLRRVAKVVREVVGRVSGALAPRDSFRRRSDAARSHRIEPTRTIEECHEGATCRFDGLRSDLGDDRRFELRARRASAIDHRTSLCGERDTTNAAVFRIRRTFDVAQRFELEDYFRRALLSDTEELGQLAHGRGPGEQILEDVAVRDANVRMPGLAELTKQEFGRRAARESSQRREIDRFGVEGGHSMTLRLTTMVVQPMLF